MIAKIIPIFSLLLLLQCFAGEAGEVIEIHDSDSEQLFQDSSSWLVMFYAPWCPACQELRPQWAKFANKERSDSLKIAQIDVSKYSALSGQFLIFHLPSIYYIHNGECIPYLGLHDMNYITKWVEQGGWKSGDPIPSWRHPNRYFARCVGAFFNFANKLRHVKNLLAEDYGVPTWLIYASLMTITLVLGLLSGLFIVCLCDCVFPYPDDTEPTAGGDEGPTEGESDGEGPREGTADDREEEEESSEGATGGGKEKSPKAAKSRSPGGNPKASDKIRKRK